MSIQVGDTVPAATFKVMTEDGPKDVLSTYVCHACDFYFVSHYQGEEKNCPRCKAEKTFKTKKTVLQH